MASGGNDSDSSLQGEEFAVFPAFSADEGGSLPLGSGWLAQPSQLEPSWSVPAQGVILERPAGLPAHVHVSAQGQQDAPPERVTASEASRLEHQPDQRPEQLTESRPKGGHPPKNKGQTHEQATGRRPKGGRPPKNRAKAPVEWTEDRIKVLLRLRYCTMKDRFDNARSNQQVGENWGLLASAIGCQIGEVVDTEQCKNKLKHMKRLWHAYNNDVNQTGNSGTIEEPPCLSLMRDLWADSEGLRSTAFLSSASASTSRTNLPATPSAEASDIQSTADTQVTSSSTAASESNETTSTIPDGRSGRRTESRQESGDSQRPRKKTKTQGEHVTKGMELLSASIAEVASAISQNNKPPVEAQNTNNDRVLQVLVEQQQQQTQLSAQLLQQQQLQSEAMQQMLAQLASIGEKLSRQH